MDFFSDFASLGYSGITLIVAFLFVTGLLFASFGLGTRPLWLKLSVVTVMAVAFVLTVGFLADERRVMMEQLKAQGGPTPKPRN